jgi:hypothetical protein
MAAETEVVNLNHCLMVLGTAESIRLAWLRAGEALQRIFAGSQPVEFCRQPRQPSGRSAVHQELPSQGA